MSIHLHPATVHFPIAFLLLASMAALLYLYWQPLEVLKILTWWPMRLGWVSTGVAILTGLWAQRVLPPQAPYRTSLNWHITTGLLIWVLYGTVLYWQWIYPKQRRTRRKSQPRSTVDTATMSAYNLQPDRSPAPELLNTPAARRWLTLLIVIGILAILASGWNGGRLVYLWGVNVDVARP